MNINNSKKNNKRIQKTKSLLRSGLGIECETSLVFKKTTSMIGSDIKRYYVNFLEFGDITEVDKIYYDNILEDKNYDVLNAVNINPFFLVGQQQTNDKFLVDAKFKDFQSDKSIIQLCEKLAKLMNYESSEVAFNKTKETVVLETTNQTPNSPSMIEIMTLNWENTPVNDIMKELTLKKKLVLKLIRADPTIKKLEEKYGEVIYPKNGAERLMLFTKDDKPKLITDYLGSYHINLTLPYTFDDELYQDIKKLYEIMKTQEKKWSAILGRLKGQKWGGDPPNDAIIDEYLKQIAIPLIEILQKQNFAEAMKNNQMIKDYVVTLNKLINNKESIKTLPINIGEKIGHDDIWKQIKELTEIMLGDFQNIHKLLGIYLQYLSPILLTNYSTPDGASFKDNNMFTEMSFRLISSKYSYINSSDIKEKGFPVRRVSTKSDFKIADIYKQLKYRTFDKSDKYEFGHDFRKDPVKGIFGFEFRILDLFPTKYMKEVLTFIYCLADHIKNTNNDYKNKISTIKNPYNNKVIVNMIKKLFLEGWNTLITKDYYDIVSKELDLKMPEWHQYLTADEMLENVYQFIRNKDKNIGFFSAQVNPEGYKIKSLTKYNRKLFNLIITKYLKRHKNDQDKNDQDKITKYTKMGKFYKDDKDIGNFIKKSKTILSEDEYEEIIDIYFYFKDIQTQIKKAKEYRGSGCCNISRNSSLFMLKDCSDKLINKNKKKMIGYSQNKEGVCSNNDEMLNKLSNKFIFKGGKGGKKVRKHKGIVQSGGNKGRLRKGYRYSGKKLKSGLPQIIKCKSKKC